MRPFSSSTPAVDHHISISVLWFFSSSFRSAVTLRLSLEKEQHKVWCTYFHCRSIWDKDNRHTCSEPFKPRVVSLFFLLAPVPSHFLVISFLLLKVVYALLRCNTPFHPSWCFTDSTTFTDSACNSICRLAGLDPHKVCETDEDLRGSYSWILLCSCYLTGAPAHSLLNMQVIMCSFNPLLFCGLFNTW